MRLMEADGGAEGRCEMEGRDGVVKSGRPATIRKHGLPSLGPPGNKFQPVINHKPTAAGVDGDDLWERVSTSGVNRGHHMT